MGHEWAVIGAGPAGIAAVGKLIDNGIDPQAIAWIDPKFTVGDFGELWRNVPSNTKVDLFLKFLQASDAFNYANCPVNFELNQLPRSRPCELGFMAEPLQWVTDHLKLKVTALQDMAEKLSFKKRGWEIKLKNHTLHAKNVIMAPGADAKNLAFPTPSIISLPDALDKEKLTKQITSEDTVAVFGSSHSAILALRNLVESSAKQVINFYVAPLVYAVYLDDWILFDDTGLKGSVAEWARENLNGHLPPNLKRVYSNEEHINHFLPQCNKVIYAVGFQRRSLPIIEGYEQVGYMPQSGIIAPGLFGLGIAYPEAKVDRLGTLEYRVGLWKFMDYLQRVIPIWLKYSP